MTSAKKVRMWHLVIALSAITIVAPLVETGLWGVKFHFRDSVGGLAMIGAGLYELRVLRQRH
jgi:hypothetical protein